MRKKYQISKKQMLQGIKKLNLQPGDVIVVEHPDTLHYLEALGRVVNFTVPLVFAPGGLQKLSRQDLLNLLENLEQQELKPDYAESPTAPL